MLNSVDVAEDMKKPLTEEEIKKRLAHLDWLSEQFAKAQKESPLPDDIIWDCEGPGYQPTRLP
jgi:hypothetical protein